jgi:hypothetical protein
MHGVTDSLVPYARRALPVFVLATVLICLASPASLRAGSMVELADLLAHPDQYDKQAVMVVGEVADLQMATTRDGQSVYGFLLKVSGGTVKVIGLGKTTVYDGVQVVVEGIFNRLRQGGRTVVLNEIKADLVRPLARLTPDFVG